MFIDQLKNVVVSLSKPSDGSYYYFSRLTDDQKVIYKTVLSGIKAYDKEIKMQMRPINEISMIFDYVILDNPLIFYVTSFNQLNDPYKKRCSVMPEYKYPKGFSKENMVHIKELLQEFDVLKEKSDMDKEAYVHDYCLDNFKYDFTNGDHAHSILGLVTRKAATCDGVAKFVKLAFDYLGVKSLVVSGKAKDPTHDNDIVSHAWNIIKINGKTYHLDVTFDMTLKNKVNRYDYFNLSDDDIKKDHIIISDIPACTSIGNDYFSNHSLVVRKFSELEDYVLKQLKQGKKNILLKMINTQYTEDIVDKIMNIATRQYSNLYKRSVAVNIGYNPSQMVFEINFK